MEVLRALWAYRGFMGGSVKREFQVKYRNSLFGAAWNVLSPLAMIVVYTVIFSQVMQARLPGVDSNFAYSIYLCAGILSWGLFAEITGRAQNIFLENANLLKKLSFPRICLPLTVLATALINFGILFGLFTVFLVLAGRFPGWVYLALIPLVAIKVLFAIGLGITLGVLNVFFRDVGHFFGILLQFWFWLTPIVYPVSALPEAMRPWTALNPMTGLIQGFQTVLVHAQWPTWHLTLPSAVLAVVFCALGLHVYRRRAGEMMDEL